MNPKIQSEQLNALLRQGYKVHSLWSVDKRVVSSQERLNAKGGLVKGTVYVDWAYWLNSNIVPHSFVLTLSNGTEISQASFEDLHATLGIVTPPVLTQGGTFFDVKMTGHDNDDVSLVDGITGLYLAFNDNSNWIKVHDVAAGEATGRVEFEVLEGRSFKVLFVEDVHYEETTFNIDGPIPLHKKILNADFRGRECQISMPNVNHCLAVMTGGRTFGQIWIKYI